MSLTHKDKGMIVIGYQGIGKSTCASLAATRDGIIDLESSIFKIDGERDENWYIIYCRIAVSLARQGYIVLISSHECVRAELQKYNPEDKYTVVVICPNYFLKDQWIHHLYDRYIHDPSNKNYAAWKDAEAHFIDSIQSMTQGVVFSIIFLNSMDYDLSGLIKSLYRASQAKAHFSQRIREEGC
jgi:hypothetical protein